MTEDREEGLCPSVGHHSVTANNLEFPGILKYFVVENGISDFC